MNSSLEGILPVLEEQLGCSCSLILFSGQGRVNKLHLAGHIVEEPKELSHPLVADLLVLNQETRSLVAQLLHVLFKCQNSLIYQGHIRVIVWDECRILVELIFLQLKRFELILQLSKVVLDLLLGGQLALQRQGGVVDCASLVINDHSEMRLVNPCLPLRLLTVNLYLVYVDVLLQRLYALLQLSVFDSATFEQARGVLLDLLNLREFSIKLQKLSLQLRNIL